MAFAIREISVPNSKLVHEITELVPEHGKPAAVQPLQPRLPLRRLGGRAA